MKKGAKSGAKGLSNYTKTDEKVVEPHWTGKLRTNSQTWRQKAHHVTPKGAKVGKSAPKAPRQGPNGPVCGKGGAPSGVRGIDTFAVKVGVWPGETTLYKNGGFAPPWARD